MALGLTKSSCNGSGDFLPSFRFNAVSGDAMIVSSAQGASGEWEKNEVDVNFPQKFIFDFENLEIGWMKFTVSGPSYIMVKIGERIPPVPNGDKDYKQGFRISLYSSKLGLSSFSNSSKTIAEVMDVLHDQYLNGLKTNTGKLPVVEIKGTKKISLKTKEGTKNYKQPDWAIVSWVERPEAIMNNATKVIAVEPPENDDEF